MIRFHKKLFAIVLTICAACASPIKQELEISVNTIESAYQSKNLERFLYLANSAVSDLIRKATIDGEMAKELRQYLNTEEKKLRYIEAFREEVQSISNVYNYQTLATGIINLRKFNALNESEATALRDHLNNWVYLDNLSAQSKLQITYSDRISSESFLADAPSQEVILKNSIDKLIKVQSSMPAEDLKPILDGIQRIKNSNESKYKAYSDFIKERAVSLTLAKIIDPYYPGFLDEFERKSKLSVVVNLKGMDKISAIDLMRQLKIQVPEVEWTEQIHTNNRSIYPELEVERVRWSEAEIPISTESFVLDRSSVDLSINILYMPDRSTFNYDLQTRGFSIEYGFLVTFRETKEGKPVEKIFRGTRESKSTSCTNQRIVNAFGGSKAANFMANSQMAYQCSQNGLSKDNLRVQVLTDLQDEIKSIARINQTILLRK